ncbi:MAG: DUF4352 domain-containing protein [Candidatus Eremiobacteraeota bacterium]|nr:DUF4352 domain-containing protein [Candidatus Eremiobacteraeota bacterium]
MTQITCGRRLAVAALIALCVAPSACQEKATHAPADSITVDPRAFTVHSLDRYAVEQGSVIHETIVVLRVTFTNNDGLPQAIAPNKFVLTDLTTGAAYLGLLGGDAGVPPTFSQTVQHGQSADVSLGFRVPAAMGSARLSFEP